MSERRAASGERVAMYTPLPPTRTGVAHYSSMLIPALSQKLDIDVNPLAARRSPLAIYHLGNNPHHEEIYRKAMQEPGVTVLHDLVLHHLIVEMTLARGDVEGYVAALRASHGEAGAAWARGRAAGLHSEMGNFLFPASIQVANRSTAVIVHNNYSAERLRSFGVTTPIHVVPHPYEPYTGPRGGAKGVIGLFGFLTSAKRADVVVEAFRRTTGKKLLVVGEPAPNIDVAAFRAEGIEFTGYVEDFDAYYAKVDRLVNLRYPSAGESSGTLMRAFAAGKPVAVSDYAQFAELPDEIVTKIPFGEGEVDALADFFMRDLPDNSAAQKKWLEENASMEKTVEGYIAAIGGGQPSRHRGTVQVSNTIPLFPKLELISVEGQHLTIRNIGDATLKARSYGEPAYRLIAKSGDWSRWLELPRDLAPGDSAVIDLQAPPGIITLHHAMESVPMLDPEPWGRAAIH
jgi:glycosyltransferase involved in cell wall biosynthesis